MHSIKPFLLKLILFSAFTMGFLLLWQMYAPARFLSNLTWMLWLFFVASTTLIHYVLVKVAEKDPKLFVGYFMGITAIKLFGYLIILTIYGLLKREAALGFTLQFLALYLLYGGFEVVMLMKHFKKRN